MEEKGQKKCKRNIEELHASETEEFEGFSSGSSVNETDNLAGNNEQYRKSNDFGKTLKEIKDSVAQLMAMKNDVSSSGNTLKEIKDAIDYLLEMKNDMDEMKLTLSNIDAKINALVEKDENSIDINQILISLPYMSIPGVEKLNKYLNSAEIFSQMKQEFSRIGGHPDKIAVIILNKLMGKIAQGQLNWSNNGATIQAFNNILRLIHSVCKANCETYTEKEGNEAIKNALKSARSAN